MSPLHLHEHGGEGPQLLLLHGYGRSLVDWDAGAAELTAQHRVLVVDLPGHGRSPDVSPWTLSTVVRQLAETLDAQGASEVVVVGHSLGGLLAVEFARAYPERVRGAVDLDGFWWGREYPGAERMGEALLASAGTVQPPGYLDEQVALSAAFGIPAARAEPAARAAVRALSDGGWRTRPERAAAAEILEVLHQLGGLGLTRWLDGVDCPLLLVQAGRRLPPAPGMEWFDELQTGFARQVAEELAVLSGVRSHLSVQTIDATHPMNLEVPQAVSTLVARFVRGLAG